MQGFGTGPFEMLVPSSIGDMFVYCIIYLIVLGIMFISEERELQFKQCQCLECHF
jgi:hypothetical protein